MILNGKKGSGNWLSSINVNGVDSIKNIGNERVKLLLGVFVVGIIVMSGCIGQPSDQEEEFHVCTCDDFDQTQYESTSPSPAVLDWISANYSYSGTRKCDQQMSDRFWAHTFTGLEPPSGYSISKATLVITVKNNHWNDTLKIDCITDPSDKWEYNVKLTELDVAVGEEKTITVDLATIPDLLSDIESNGFLDIAVDDDSTVDCAVLYITYSPS
jgi:hypothetical protein